MRLLLIFLTPFLIANHALQESQERITERPARPEFADANRARIPYYRYGKKDAPQVIMIHGGPGLPGYMKTLGAKLKENFDIVEAYQRDSQMAESRAQFDIATAVEDLKAIVDKVRGDKPVILLAHSMGAVVALEFAKKYPRLSSKLILVDPAAIDLASDQKFQENITTRAKEIHKPNFHRKEAALIKAFDTATNLAQINKATHDYMDLFWPAYFPNNQKPDSLRFGLTIPERTQEFEADYQKRLADKSLQANLDKITIPVVHFHGDKDPLPSETTKKLLGGLDGYRHQTVEGAGHFPWLDDIPNSAFLDKLNEELKK